VRVEVRLYGALRRYRPAGLDGPPTAPFIFTLPLGSTVDSLAATLGIPDGFVSAAAVNDVAVENDALLTDGDRASLFPPSAGGMCVLGLVSNPPIRQLAVDAILHSL
jgi:molybdopterin converting factor small subunit